MYTISIISVNSSNLNYTISNSMDKLIERPHREWKVARSRSDHAKDFENVTIVVS